MTEDEIIRFVSALPDVGVVTASAESGAPEVAWGDSFFYAPAAAAAGQHLPFATIVVGNYPGFDEESRLDRPEVFRVNVAVGARRFDELLGYPPADFEERRSEIDFAALDTVLPHPLYAVQGWVSVLVPGIRTDGLVRTMLQEARTRAAARYRG